MSLWRTLRRVFGLSSDIRAHVSTRNVDVVITGDPDQVQKLLSVVKRELERIARSRRAISNAGGPAVRPTDLDEMDSPYALPEAAGIAGRDDTEPTDLSAAATPTLRGDD